MDSKKMLKLNIFVMMVVVAYTILVYKYFTHIKNVPEFILNFFLWLSSIGFYQIIISFIYSLISNLDTLLQLYWGEEYIAGYWSYTYTLDGIEKYGIWRIEQDLFNCTVKGFGLTDNYTIRSRVRSAKKFEYKDGLYEFLNIRDDIPDGDTQNYSLTRVYFDRNPKRRFFFFEKYPTILRGTTHIFGGKYDGKYHPDVIFRKHINAKSEEEAINELREFRKSKIVNSSCESA